jgi:diamine N-acetyltransferase
MVVYGITGYDEPAFAANNYCILRLMIGSQYQKQGYGTDAFGKILDYIRTFPAGPAECCWISYEADNLIAKKLYESFGFRECGEIYNNEPVSVLKL